MLLRVMRNFLTLVALSTVAGVSFAAPHFDAPTSKNTDEIVDPDAKPPSPEAVENYSVSTPPETPMGRMVTKFNKANYFYPFRKEIAFHAGVVFGLMDSSDDKDLMNGLVGFSYLLPRDTSPKWEVGADLSTVGHGHGYVTRRIIYNEKGSFRPYYSYGVLHKFVPEERFASLSNSENYLGRFAVGLADIVRHPKSVQLELALAAGTEDVLVTFTYGYAWGF
jgi:hypothetical protein